MTTHSLSAFSRHCIIPVVLLFAGLGSFGDDHVPAEHEQPADGMVHPQTTESGTKDSPTLTLPEALSRALRRNPRLAAFEWDFRAADAMILQAGLRKNPELSVALEDVRWRSGPSEETDSTTVAGAIQSGPSVDWERERGPGARSGFRESEFTISIAQPIELGRKRAKRVAHAEGQKELVFWDYQSARAEVLAQTASDFVEVLAAQERVSLDGELVELAQKIVHTFSLRVSAGQVSPLELSRAEVALATTQLTLEESQGALESARAILASNWGGTWATFERAAGRLDEIHQAPALEALEARMSRNPDLARWSAELISRRADFTSERAQRIPDLTVELGFRSTGVADRKSTRYGLGSSGGFGYTQSGTGYSDRRENSLVLGFSLPLPLFNRNQGRIAAAEAMIAKVSEERRVTETTVHAELIAARQTASDAHSKARTLRDEVIPKIEDTFEKVQRGYEQGKFNYLEVLDAQRMLFEAREAYLQALIRYHQGVVRMERLTGQTVDEAAPGEEGDAKDYGENQP